MTWSSCTSWSIRHLFRRCSSSATIIKIRGSLESECSMRLWMRISLVAAAVLLCALPAHTELVYFANGRTMSIKSHRLDGDSLVLVMRAGGEITCEPSMIARIAPDEVPYPEDTNVGLKPDATNDGRSVRLQPDVPYSEIIDKVSAAQGVDAKLVRAVIQVESAYQERAKSRKGAMGLMQLMPE